MYIHANPRHKDQVYRQVRGKRTRTDISGLSPPGLTVHAMHLRARTLALAIALATARTLYDTRSRNVHACAGSSAAGHAVQIARLVLLLTVLLECVKALDGHTIQTNQQNKGGRLESALCNTLD